ncbi:tol-pal system YbgF family protein [Cellulophaga baltica]|uniref:tol-pal system YbgF family protein n=1 Tax=Cellulophaga baltica TaxID=76594 RepID=UPI0037CB5D9D
MEEEILLEKFLNEKLNEKERLEFDVLMENDLDFKKEVLFQIDVKRSLTAIEDDDFRNLLSEFESEIRNKEAYINKDEHRKRNRFSFKWVVAASITMLLLVGSFLFTNLKTSPEELFTQNFKPYRNVIQPITRGESLNDNKFKAFLAYSKGEYKQAIPLFNTLYSSEGESYYLFYEAISLIQLRQADKAVPLLQEHLKSQDALVDKTNWYLAMAYLQLQDIEQAKKTLKLIIEDKTYKAKEAKQLLDLL